MSIQRVCIIGASGKLGRYMVEESLRRGYEVVGVCRERSVHKLDDLADRMTIVPGATNDREVARRAVAGCDGVLTVLAPWGVQQYSSGTARPCSTTRRRGRGWSSRAAGTSPVTAWTATRGGSGRRWPSADS
ncbi:NAD(P)H-binding protein [Janibacter anophelis]|uniref:NAD(P)H-binding protein n=1 Tax=Janibacter anophelis TaxID=319054 RepID=UPI001C3F28CF|nr:NAD(P)H-binding protein [Janibacter anophelis]